MLKEAVAELDNVEVEDFDGLVVNYVKGKSANVVVRGLRMISDFEYEFQMALTNRKINPDIETIFMMPNESYSYLSSRLIKEVAFMNADVSMFVPGNVEKKLKEKIKGE
jgi:pantetheine-phosphate adenylyltransferase